MKKIILKKEQCIGCSMCASVAPSVFEMGQDGLVTLKKETDFTEKEREEIENAITSCPANVISLEEEEGKKD